MQFRAGRWGLRLAVLAATVVGATTLASGARATSYEPLDCEKAASPAQTTICKSYGLGQAEAHMATLFEVTMSLSAMGARGDIGTGQRDWLKEREACGAETACLARSYRTRIEHLQKIFDGIASRGPF